MKLTTKKIIAKEFLILIVILIVSVLFGLCIFPYNAYRLSQIKSTEIAISSQVKKNDSLSFEYNRKRNTQEIFFNSLSSEFDITKADQNTPDETWKILGEVYHSDSIPFNYERIWDASLVKFLKSKGYNSGKEFESFIGKNLLTKNDSINYEQSEKIKYNVSELKNKVSQFKNKIFDSNEQLKFSIVILIILLSIAYPIRFLILGIKWSFKTIKQKD